MNTVYYVPTSAITGMYVNCTGKGIGTYSFKLPKEVVIKNIPYRTASESRSAELPKGHLGVYQELS
jgi:hypothetical protein